MNPSPANKPTAVTEVGKTAQAAASPLAAQSHVLTLPSTNFEERILIASGVADYALLAQYRDKLNTLVEQFREYQSNTLTRLSRKLSPYKGETQDARELFDFLYKNMGRRYGECPELTNAIEQQSTWRKNSPVGNCVALTALYTVLAGRLAIPVSIGLMNADRMGELHVRNLVTSDSRDIPVENTSRNGFDHSQFRQDRYDHKGSATLLVPVTYITRAERFVKAGKLTEAMDLLANAIESYPTLDSTYYTAGSLMLRPPIASPEQAIPFYLKGVECRASAGNYFGLASAYAMNQQIQEALIAFSKALDIDPRHLETLLNLGSLLMQLGQKEDASKCFNRAAEADDQSKYRRLIEESLKACR